MSKTILRFIFSLLLAAYTPSFAQEAKSDTTIRKFIPTGIRVGTDILSLIRSNTSEKFSGWEVNTDIDFYRYYVTLDWGTWSSHYALKNGTYDNDGRYFRLGTDVNFLLKDPDRNMFFLGFRYGRSQFDNNSTYIFSDDYFDDITIDAVDNNVIAGWKELTGGLRVKIWKWLWMGYTARFKFGLNVKGEQNLKTYDVPGYGLTLKNNYWGFNYQVYIRLPIRKQPGVQEEK